VLDYGPRLKRLWERALPSTLLPRGWAAGGRPVV